MVLFPPPPFFFVIVLFWKKETLELISQNRTSGDTAQGSQIVISQKTRRNMTMIMNFILVPNLTWKCARYKDTKNFARNVTCSSFCRSASHLYGLDTLVKYY